MHRQWYPLAFRCVLFVCVIHVEISWITVALKFSRHFKNSIPRYGQVVGNFIEFGKDQCGFILDMYKQYGPCYSMGMMGQNLTFLVGPDVSEAFFAAKDEELSQPEVYGFMKPVFGSNVVYDAAPKVFF